MGGLLRFADSVDKLLMFLGIAGSIGEGLASPLTMYIVSGAIDAFGTSDQSIANVVVVKIPNTVAQVCAFIFGFLVAFLLSWRMALASLPLTLGYIIPVVTFGRLMMNTEVKSKDAYEVAGSILEQAISNIRTVYSYVGEQKTVDKYGQALQESTKLGIKQGLMKGLMIGSMGMLFATWAFQSWVGGILVTEKGERGGHVFVAGASIINGGMACMTALPNVPFITNASAAATRIFEMIDRTPVIDTTKDEGRVLTNVRGRIEFRQVYFSYPSRKDELILQGLSLKIKPGMKIGLVGGSGSGKSTIMSLLERFYDPVKGDILLDGHRIKRLQLKWYRSQFGLVSQEPVLFATSIKENILFGREDEASLKALITAAKAANAHNFIIEFPQGYDTQVGPLGVQLSGGQKQRIVIARALLRDPRILLLDEATSALDSLSESIVQEAIDQASEGRTTIIIAHRLSSIRNVDRIMVLDSGRIIESGSHDELMGMNRGGGGVYSQMVRLQKFDLNHDISQYQQNRKRLMNCHSLSSRRGSDILNSPASPFSCILPISVPSSTQNSPASSFSVNYGDDKKLDSYTSPNPSIWRLLEMNFPEWKRGLLGALGAVVVGAVLAVNSYCMGALIFVYFEKPSKVKSETKLYSMIFISICIIVFFCNILQHYNFGIMGERLTKRMREKVFEKILTFEIGWFDKEENSSAAICARLSTEANMVRSLVGDRVSLLVQVFTNAVVSFTVALIITWKVSLVLIAIQPFIIVSYYYKTVLMKQMSAEAQEAQNVGSQLASEAVVNHRTITAFSCQKRMVDLFEATLAGPRKQSIRQSWISGIGLCSSQFFTVAAVSLTFWYGGILMAKGFLSAKQLFIAYIILMSTGRTIADAGTMTSDLSKGSSAVGAVFNILDRKTKIKLNSPEGIKIKKTLQGKIGLDGVYFYYPSRPGQMIFQGLSLSIEAGKTKVLVGQSGSGKSTVIGLIERFYDPVKGTVLIDDRDIRSYNLRECGERGVQLSGGQKQRIALARAVLKNPTILLLDEATSALDSVSENLVQEALDRMMVGRTCVIIAHRLSTIRMADCIAVIKNGKIVEEGSHYELLARGENGAYYSLVRLQQNNSRRSY